MQALFNTFLNKCPFGSCYNTWDNIKRKYLFNTLAAIINGKGDTLAHK